MIGNRAPHMLRDAMHCIAPQHEGKVLLPISCQHDLTLRRRASAVSKGVPYDDGKLR